jgi:nodulation protein E
MKRRVVITGLGCISGMGLGVSGFWQALEKGQSAICALSGVDSNIKIPVGVQVNNYDPEGHFSPEELTLLDRFSQFAVLSSREAIKHAGLSLGGSVLARAAGVIGTGCGGKHTDEDTYKKLYKEGRPRVHPLTIPKGMPSAAASMVSQHLGIRGPVFSIASACASGAHAIIQGAMMIRSGLVDVAVVGGTDAPFTYGLLKSWESLRVVSNDTCRPFSRDRSGMVLGEGAAMVVLESSEHAKSRGAVCYAELAGFGMTSDAGHITRPDTEGIATAMRAALIDAGVATDAVDYINAHGTGTETNDQVETEAIHMVFGEYAREIAISSTKSMHGHALGAASAMELVATILAINNSVVPPTANFTSPGEGCDLDYVPNVARPARIDFALSNSFAFGGLNAVIAVRTMKGGLFQDDLLNK